MKTLTINSRDAIGLQIIFDAAEIDLDGDGNAGEIRFSYGYFADDRETLDDEAMRPEPDLGSPGTVLVRQLAAQVAKARSAGAHLRLVATIPRGMTIQDSRIESGTLFLRRAGGVDISLNSGTVEAVGNNGRHNISVNSGTLRLAGLASGFRHFISVESGTLTLHAGVLLPFVEAEVKQGLIQGEHGGRLERFGQSGWRLVPLHPDTYTSLQCRVGSGAILLQA